MNDNTFIFANQIMMIWSYLSCSWGFANRVNNLQRDWTAVMETLGLTEDFLPRSGGGTLRTFIIHWIDIWCLKSSYLLFPKCIDCLSNNWNLLYTYNHCHLVPSVGCTKAFYMGSLTLTGYIYIWMYSFIITFKMLRICFILDQMNLPTEHYKIIFGPHKSRCIQVNI